MYKNLVLNRLSFFLKIGQIFVYGKEWKLFYKNEVEGGSCSYWTLLFKEFFDKLKNMGMSIDSNIFYYPNNDIEKGWRGHSGLVINFYNTDYIIDFAGFNSIGSGNTKIIQSVDDLNDEYGETSEQSKKQFDHFKYKNILKYYNIHIKNKNSKKEPTCLFFKDRSSFVDRWMQRSWSSAMIQLRPNLDGESSKEVKYDFYPEKIILRIGDDEVSFFLDKEKLRKGYKINDSKICDFLISCIKFYSKSSGVNSINKDTLKKYLGIIHSKINIQNLRNIYGL